MTNKGFKIIEKTDLCRTISRHVVYAPLVAARAKPGNFVILRVYEGGERIPLTIFDWDPPNGTITLIIQSAGKSTCLLNNLKKGDNILNLAGPLGIPVEIRRYGTAVCVGGGVGAAEMYPIARALKEAGNRVISVLGFRTADLLILEEEAKKASDLVFVTTDDGSRGERGTVVDSMQKLRDKGERPDVVFVIGPVKMMKAVTGAAGGWGIPVYASLNPLMLDGTGMCGCCRVEVGGRTVLACVEGPVFDARLVNFDLLLSRTGAYKKQEKEALEGYSGGKHICGLDAH